VLVRNQTTSDARVLIMHLLGGRKARYKWKKTSQCQFIHHKSYKGCLKFEMGFRAKRSQKITNTAKLQPAFTACTLHLNNI
jgi:hypothetical protein